MRIILAVAALALCLSSATAGPKGTLPPPIDAVTVVRGDFLYTRYVTPAPRDTPKATYNYALAQQVCADHDSTLLTLDNGAEFTDLFVGDNSLFPATDFMFNGSSQIWLGLVNDTNKPQQPPVVTWEDGLDHPGFFEPGVARFAWASSIGAPSCDKGGNHKCCAGLNLNQHKVTQPIVFFWECGSTNLGVNVNKTEGATDKGWVVLCKSPKPPSPPPPPSPSPSPPPSPSPSPSPPPPKLIRGPCWGQGYHHIHCMTANKTMLAANRSITECIDSFLTTNSQCRGSVVTGGHEWMGCDTYIVEKFNTKQCRDDYLAQEDTNPGCVRMAKNGINLPINTMISTNKTTYHCTGGGRKMMML